MSRAKKLNTIISIIVILFFGAYARHKYIANQIVISGRLEDKEMDEISGIAASGLNNNMYYVHNDSGDTSRFFAISPDGTLHATVYFKGDKKTMQGVYDCEDIAVGPGPADKKSYVYVGDIGDNFSLRPYITVYRFDEQQTWDRPGRTTAIATPLNLKYPDGPRDAETLMIDPLEKLIYIVTKRHDTVSVYTTPLSYKPNDTVTLTRRSKLFFEGIKPFKWITAGDISKNGQQVLLKSYEKIYYWKRRGNEHLWETMQRPAEEIKYQPEKQGEAIGFTPDGKGAYTTSEGVFSPIYYYKIPD